MVHFDISGKKPYRHVGLDRVVTSMSLGGVMVSAQAWNARDVGSIPTLNTNFAFPSHL